MSFLRWWLTVACDEAERRLEVAGADRVLGRREQVDDLHAGGIAESLEERRGRGSLVVGERGTGERPAAGEDVEGRHIDENRNE